MGIKLQTVLSFPTELHRKVLLTLVTGVVFLIVTVTVNLLRERLTITYFELNFIDIYRRFSDTGYKHQTPVTHIKQQIIQKEKSTFLLQISLIIIQNILNSAALSYIP